MKVPKKKNREEYENCINIINLFRKGSSVRMLNEIIILAMQMKNMKLAQKLLRKLNLHLREIVINMG